MLVKLFGFFVSLQEMLFLKFSLLAQSCGVEIRRLDGTRLVSPCADICIVKRGFNRHIVLFLPHFKLVGHRGVASALQFFDLVSVVNCVIEYLPLFGSSFVGFDFTFLSPGQTYHVFDPVLEFHEHFLHSGVVIHAGDSSRVPNTVHLIVIVRVVMLTGSEVVP